MNEKCQFLVHIFLVVVPRRKRFVHASFHPMPRGLPCYENVQCDHDLLQLVSVPDMMSEGTILHSPCESASIVNHLSDDAAKRLQTCHEHTKERRMK